MRVLPLLLAGSSLAAAAILPAYAPTFQGSLVADAISVSRFRAGTEAGEWLAVQEPGGLTLFEMRDGRLSEATRIALPDTSFAFSRWGRWNEKRRATLSIGDVDDDGKDDALFGLGRKLHRYSWSGAGWDETVDSLPCVPRQCAVGDLTGDGHNELVVAGFSSAPWETDYARHERQYRVELCRWTDSGPEVLWDDSTSLGLGEPNMPDFLCDVADYLNLGFNQLQVTANQSDVGPTRYLLFRWDSIVGGIRLVRRFAISESLVAQPAWDLLPFAGGRLQPYERDGRTWFVASMVRPGRLADGLPGQTFHIESRRIAGDSVVRGPTHAVGETSTHYVVTDPDGRGPGVMCLVQDRDGGCTWYFLRLS